MSTKGITTRHRDKKRVREWGRRCKICGKSSYPNYFYCPNCHGRFVSKLQAGEDVSVSVENWGDILSEVPINETRRIY